jgi:hypothetical protein
MRRKIKRYPPMSGVGQKRTLPSVQQRINRFTSLEGASDFANDLIWVISGHDGANLRCLL